jgi:myo-inositol-1(or 4)-monophosphatase
MERLDDTAERYEGYSRVKEFENTASPAVEDLRRIRACLHRVAAYIVERNFNPAAAAHADPDNPTTALDREIDRLIFESLPLPGEGWLSEESADDPSRLQMERLWVVDPIDGTREFVQGIPEWCVSVAMVENQRAVAGGVLNPSTGELFLGATGAGLLVEGTLQTARYADGAAASAVLVSRREHRLGHWTSSPDAESRFFPVGSIAYRLAHVAAGCAAATCTLDPRSEWDIAGGVALVLAAGGCVQTVDGAEIRFNQPNPKVPSFFASAKNCEGILGQIRELHSRP